MKNGWQTKKLGDLVEVQNGYAFSSKDYSQSGHFLMRIGNVQNGRISTSDPKFIKLPSDGSLERFVLYEGDILVSLTGNVGRVGVMREEHLPAALNQRVARISIRKDSPATRELILLFLYSDRFREELSDAGHGAAQQNVSTKDLVEIEIHVPPLDEQKRIVAKLDEAFVSLAKAKENAEKNLQNARALFESTLDEVFTRNSEDWAVKQLEDVCAIGDGNHSSNYPKKHELVAKGVPFIRATNLVGGEISNEDMRFLSPKKHSQLKKGHLKTGDILFTNRGEIGKMAIVDPSHDGSNLNSQVAWLRCSETLNNRFLFHFLNSGKIKAHLESAKNGAALQQFTIKQIKELKIPIPSKDQQREIVLGLDGLSKETQRLARLYEQKLEAMDSLKKSILHEAFSGNL